MFQLAYISAACAPFSSVDLQLLLAQAREKNVVYSVTGMLLYHSGSFLQLLEGPNSSVERIFASIKRDRSHHHIKVLFRKAVDSREFEDWSMGFIDTSLWRLIPGKIDYNRVPQIATASTAAQRYLRLFHQGLCRQALLV